MKFPAITLWQPSASLIFAGLKAHETRAFPLPEAKREVWIAIHAARRSVPLVLGLHALCRREFGPDYRETLPRGRVLGLVKFGPSRPTEAAPAASAEDQMAGNWEPGRFAWPIIDRRSFEQHVYEATGRQGWFSVDLEPPPELGE